jgi:hypothetical protein
MRAPSAAPNGSALFCAHTLCAFLLRATLGPRIAGKSMAEANVEGSLIVGEIRETVNSNLANFQRELDAI